MIRVATDPQARGSTVNPLRGEFALGLAGAHRRFDTRLSTVAAIEAACGDRPVVEVLNAVIAGRRARDQIPLLAAALREADPAPADPEAAAAAVTVSEAEAFILALIFALGFTVGQPGEAGGTDAPLDGAPSGGPGVASPSAA